MQHILAHYSEDEGVRIEYTIGKDVSFYAIYVSYDPFDWGVNSLESNINDYFYDIKKGNYYIWSGTCTQHPAGWVGDTYEYGEDEFEGDWKPANYRDIKRFLEMYRDCRWSRRDDKKDNIRTCHLN